jgi:transposase
MRRAPDYEQLLDAHPPPDTIYVVCDNATSYKNKELTDWLATTRIRQLFLPPYSPNRNLIERRWKLLPQKILNTTFYRTKDLFRQAMLDFFAQLPQVEQELTSLLTRKFHILDAQPSS